MASLVIHRQKTTSMDIAKILNIITLGVDINFYLFPFFGLSHNDD